MRLWVMTDVQSLHSFIGFWLQTDLWWLCVGVLQKNRRQDQCLWLKFDMLSSLMTQSWMNIYESWLSVLFFKRRKHLTNHTIRISCIHCSYTEKHITTDNHLFNTCHVFSGGWWVVVIRCAIWLALGTGHISNISQVYIRISPVCFCGISPIFPYSQYTAA